MKGKKIIIGSRGSALALWQAHYTQERLIELGYQAEIKIIKTQGDRVQDLGFDKLEGKGFFTKELEEELLNGTIDLAVHSYKDLPTQIPEGLEIAGHSYRAAAEDILIYRQESEDKHQPFVSVKKDAVIGTSSPRRKAQLQMFRPDLNIEPIRGNVPTRIEKLKTGLDGVVLAAAGVERLGIDLSDYRLVKFEAHRVIPAAAQGVLAFQVHQDNETLKSIVKELTDLEVSETLKVERTLLQLLDGGCRQPIGIFCKKLENLFHLWAVSGRSQADTSITNLRRIHLSSVNAESLPSRALKILKGQPPRRVFISRNLTEQSYFLRYFKALNTEIVDQSLLEFEEVDFALPMCDWLFFSSAKAANFFFQKSQLPKNVKIGAIGEGTAHSVKKLGYPVDFTGQGSDLKQIGCEFLKHSKGSKVVFPQAQLSRSSIWHYTKDEIEGKLLTVYLNKKRTQKIPGCDIYVFTSPFNVEAFFDSNSPTSGIFVAIGPSTEAALLKAGIKSVRTAFEPGEPALVEQCY